MDLRKFLKGDIEPAARILNYQPFILSDDVETGAAYSWMRGGDPRTTPPLVLRRDQMTPDDWRLAVDANGRLRAMYDDILDEIAKRYPAGSMIDIACNNGYLPVGAELRGLRGTGIDAGSQYSQSVEFLNGLLGTKARFVHGQYDSRTHHLPHTGLWPVRRETFDVAVISAIVCHLPDPLNFLAAVGKVTGKMIVFWGQMVDTERLLISYQSPHPSLSSLTDFPHSFNDNTRISVGMFREAARQMGFRDVVEIKPKSTWLLALSASRDIPLEQELGEGSRHVALMAIR